MRRVIPGHTLPRQTTEVPTPSHLGQTVVEDDGEDYEFQSAEGEVAGAEVSVKLEFAGAALGEGAEETAVRFAEGLGVDVAGQYGRIDVGVVSRVADGNVQIAGV